MRPSARLIRAVTAERADLERQRERLAREAADLRAALARIEAGMAAIDEQYGLLERLVPAVERASGASGASDGGVRPAGGASDGAGVGAAGGVRDAASVGAAGKAGVAGAPGGAGDAASASGAGAPSGAGSVGAVGPVEALRGPAIREVAVRLLVEEGLEGLHYREWFALLTRNGHEVAGKDPLAVFLTQLTRSPVVRKSSTPGRYELDRQAAQRLKRRIDRLQREYLTATRAQRNQIAAEIARTERQLDEADRAIPLNDLEDAA